MVVCVGVWVGGDLQSMKSIVVLHSMQEDATPWWEAKASLHRIAAELRPSGPVTRHSMWRTAALLAPWSLVVQVTSKREILIPPQPVPRTFNDAHENKTFHQYALGEQVRRCCQQHCLSKPVTSSTKIIQHMNLSCMQAPLLPWS